MGADEHREGSAVRDSKNVEKWAKGDLNPHVPKDTGT